MPLCTSGFSSSFFTPGSPREAAEAGCSRRKCAPREICLVQLDHEVQVDVPLLGSSGGGSHARSASTNPYTGDSPPG
eukprot:737192-Alexandrium_andersonii.AAC.1